MCIGYLKVALLRINLYRFKKQWGSTALKTNFGGSGLQEAETHQHSAMSITVILKKIYNLPGKYDRKVELSFRGKCWIL